MSVLTLVGDLIILSPSANGGLFGQGYGVLKSLGLFVLYHNKKLQMPWCGTTGNILEFSCYFQNSKVKVCYKFISIMV